MSERDEFYRRFSQSYDKLHQSEMQDDLVERVAREIHDGLGGDGWGYCCYGGNEEFHKADELRSAARAAIAVALEEAAKVADAYDPRCDVCPRGVATAIRALIPKGGS